MGLGARLEDEALLLLLWRPAAAPANMEHARVQLDLRHAATADLAQLGD